MRWSVFAVVAYLLLVLQVGLAPHIAFGSRSALIEPQFPLVLAVFVALAAPMRTSLIACSILGLLLDLSNAYPIQSNAPGNPLEHAALTVIGPFTLGYLAAGYMVVQMRPMLLRQHPLTIATMMLAAGAAVQVIVLATLTVRGWYDPIENFRASEQLLGRMASLLYSGAVGLLLAYPLTRYSRFFGFPAGKQKRG